MNRLLQCVKIATLSVAILIAFCLETTAQPMLSEHEIRSQIIGHSFQGRKGMLSVTVRYNQDGAVTMQSPLGSANGNWTLSDGQLCVTLLSGPRKGTECMTFISEADGKYRASNGLQLIPGP